MFIFFQKHSPVDSGATGRTEGLENSTAHGKIVIFVFLKGSVIFSAFKKEVMSVKKLTHAPAAPAPTPEPRRPKTNTEEEEEEGRAGQHNKGDSRACRGCVGGEKGGKTHTNTGPIGTSRVSNRRGQIRLQNTVGVGGLGSSTASSRRLEAAGLGSYFGSDAQDGGLSPELSAHTSPVYFTPSPDQHG